MAKAVAKKVAMGSLCFKACANDNQATSTTEPQGKVSLEQHQDVFMLQKECLPTWFSITTHNVVSFLKLEVNYSEHISRNEWYIAFSTSS